MLSVPIDDGGEPFEQRPRVDRVVAAVVGVGHVGLRVGAHLQSGFLRGIEHDAHALVVEAFTRVEALPRHRERVDAGGTRLPRFAPDVGRRFGRVELERLVGHLRIAPGVHRVPRVVVREHETRDPGRQLHRGIGEERRRADELAAAGGREAVDKRRSIEIPQRVHLDLRLAAGIGGELPCDRAGRPGIGENDVELNVGGSAGGIPRQTQSAAGTPDRQRRRPVEHGGDEAGEADAVNRDRCRGRRRGHDHADAKEVLARIRIDRPNDTSAGQRKHRRAQAQPGMHDAYSLSRDVGRDVRLQPDRAGLSRRHQAPLTYGRRPFRNHWFRVADLPAEPADTVSGVSDRSRGR